MHIGARTLINHSTAAFDDKPTHSNRKETHPTPLEPLLLPLAMDVILL